MSIFSATSGACCSFLAVTSGPKSMAIHRVSSLLSNAILAVMVNGTDNSIPTGPKTHPQKISDKKTTSVDRPRPRPMNLGSMTFPTSRLITTKPDATIIDLTNPNCIRASNTAGMAAIIEPILGT